MTRDPRDTPLLGSDPAHTPGGRRWYLGSPGRPRYGTRQSASVFAGVGAWLALGDSNRGANLEAALPYLDWLAVKYPLDGMSPAESSEYVHDVLDGLLADAPRNPFLHVWEQDRVTGWDAVDAYDADGWIGVGETPQAFETVSGAASAVPAPRAIATTFVPIMWPTSAVAMFECYAGSGTPIIDNTPLAQLAALGAPAVCPILGGWGDWDLAAWYPSINGQGFPGVSVFGLDEFQPGRVRLLGGLEIA